MNKSCVACKHSAEIKPGGQKPSSGTIWCGKRSIQMAKNREMPCFVSFGGKKIRHCAECKKAKITTPSGSALHPGNVWCEKKKTEIHKMRSLDCFEPSTLSQGTVHV